MRLKDDLINLYKRYYKEIDFCDMFRIYEGNYPLLEEEKNLLLCLMSLPEKLEFNEREFSMCKKVSNFYEYINATDRLINDYLPYKTESTI